MNKLILFFSVSFFSTTINATVCNQIKAIEGFSSTTLFDKAIINSKPLDYYTFASECDANCLIRDLKRKGIAYSLDRNIISVFDKTSVSTIIIESSYKQLTTGYMTCSSTVKRNYISNPISLNNKKITLDLQTEDYKNITRTINLEKYSRTEYSKLLGQLDKLTKNRESAIGFTNYKLTSRGYIKVMKVSKLSPRGDFIFIIEQSR